MERVGVLSDAELRDLIVIEFVHTQARGNPAFGVNIEAIEDEIGGDDRAKGIVRNLALRGLVGLPNESLSRSLTPHVTEASSRYLEELENKRADAVQRQKAARAAILHWLYDLDARNTYATATDDIADTDYCLFYGKPLDIHDIRKANKWLIDKGLIKGHGTFQGPTIRPTITTAGKDAIEYGDATMGNMRPGLVIGDNNIIGNLAHASSRTVQHSLIDASPTQVAMEFLNEIYSKLDELGLDDVRRQEISELIQQRTQPEIAEKPGKIRELLWKVGGALGAATMTPVGQALATRAIDIAGALPIG